MRDQMILVTGAAGLIGRSVTKLLRAMGASVVEVDIRHDQVDARKNVCNQTELGSLFADVTGVIHLAAVSRVIDGQKDPGRCWEVNVQGTGGLIELCLGSQPKPWLFYASSREVYGQHEHFPVKESSPLCPMNIYAQSKVAAEQLIAQARASQMTTAIGRFSSVYGDAKDYVDRVVPAFASAAIRGGEIRLDGRDNFLDFTHVEDVADGIGRVVRLLASGENTLPAIHFVSGIPTTLSQLASMAAERARARVTIVDGSPRSFDVGRFYGDPSRALELLGWRTRIDLQSGFARLADDIEASLSAPSIG
jgi:nucleoside-diphosphate-sugar epimerase